MQQLAYTQNSSQTLRYRKLHRKMKAGFWLVLFLGLGMIALIFTTYYLTKQVKAAENKINTTLNQYDELLQEHNTLLQEYKEIQEQQETLNQKFQLEKETLLQEKEELLKEVENLKKQSLQGGKKSKKIAYLTFDDGPSANTKKILDTLQAEDVKATFFVIGQGLKNEDKQALIKRIGEEGHQLGNHTYTHNYSYIYSSKDAFLKELNQLEEEIKKLTGTKMTMVRFPGGSNNKLYKKYNKSGENVMAQIKEELKQKGYVYVDWNVDSMDAKTKELKSKEAITKAVVSQAVKQDQAVILMHDAQAKTTTAEALPEIIRQLKEKGYEFDILTPNSTQVQF